MTVERRLLLRSIRIPPGLISSGDEPLASPGMDYIDVDLLIDGERVSVVKPGEALAVDQFDQIVDGDHRMIVPAFAEVHAHLDKCHTIGRLGQVGGDLMAAIEAQVEDKIHWSRDDISRRAAQGLEELYRSGCRAVRTHVDWSRGAEAPLAWEVMTGLSHEWRGKLQLQCAALIDLDLFADDAMARSVVQRIASDGGVLGVFVLDHYDLAEKLKRVFELAACYELNLDFHVDEGLDFCLGGIEVIADTALASDYKGHILCSHVCSLMNYESVALARVIDKIKRSRIAVCGLPSTNLYLQGRNNGTPDRRGITRLKELSSHQVCVAVGTDNVADAFCPVGRHDPLNSLSLAVMTAHLDPPFSQWLPCITTDAMRAIGLPPTYVDGAAVENLLMTNARSTAELVAGGLAAPKDLAAFLSAETTR